MSDPIDDPLVATLEHLFEGQEGNTKLLAEIGRDVESMAHELTGAVQEFGSLHGTLQALEHEEAQERKRMHADIKLVLEAVRGMTTRLTTREGKVAGIELHLHERANGNGTG
jgi:hypothetical protein